MLFIMCYDRPAKNIKGYRLLTLKVLFLNKKSNRKFYFPNFPNQYSNLDVCLGIQNPCFSSIEELKKGVIARFWTSKFEGIFHRNYDGVWRKSCLSTYKAWQIKTQQDPNWIPTTKDMKPIEDEKLLKLIFT